MSRSYKKNPIIKDGRSGRTGKKFANKKVRRYKGEIQDRKAYKKLYESWDIHDYISMETYYEHKVKFESDLKAYLNGGSKYDPRDDTRWYNHWYSNNHWAKCYKRK